MDCDLHSSALAAYTVVRAEIQAKAESVVRMVAAKGVNSVTASGVTLRTRVKRLKNKTSVVDVHRDDDDNDLRGSQWLVHLEGRERRYLRGLPSL